MRIGYIGSDLSPHHKKKYTASLQEAGCKKILQGTASLKRDESGALEALKAGDVLVVVTLDQLANSVRELDETLEQLSKQRVEVRSLKEDLDTSTTNGKLFTQHLSTIVGFQRSLFQKALLKAKAEGNVGGRPALMDEKTVAAARKLYEKGKTPAWAIAEKFNVSLSTLYRYLAKQ